MRQVLRLKYFYIVVICLLITTMAVVGLTGCGSDDTVNVGAAINESTPAPTNTGSGSSGTGQSASSGSTYTLTTSVSPAGSGTITTSGTNFAAGTKATITAIPASGYAFSRWSGDASGTGSTTTVTMNTNKNVIAHFSASGVERISITPASATAAMNRSLQFLATAHYSDGSTSDVTNTASWASYNPSIASVGSGGRVTCVFPGSATITAMVGSVKGTATLTVTRY